MSRKRMLQLGIDVGSTTVKAVVVDSRGEALWKDYRRHNTRQPETVRDFLTAILQRFDDCRLNTFITGSGGRAIAPHINARYIQEVNAVTYAVERLHPDTNSAIELGGQDAKVIIWSKDDRGLKTSRAYMNDKCAGGTGATLDKIFGKIGITMQEAASIRATGKTVHHIAAKCGVFAETDVVGLLKAGVDHAEIVVSLAAAIVRQNLEVLVHGNVLRDEVLLLGGPHTYLPVFSDLWRHYIPRSWEIHHWKPAVDQIEQSIRVPDNAQFFAAFGAVLFGSESDELFRETHEGELPEAHIVAGLEKLDRYISDGRIVQLASSGAVRDGLAASEQEVKDFAARYAIPPFDPPALGADSPATVWIGVDGGSTSSKLVVIDQNNEVLYRDYILSKGNPIIDVREMFARVRDWSRETGAVLDIAGAGVTGYAASILQQAFSLDCQVVETVAHMNGAVCYYGDVDVVCDVGGQDIKVLFMKHGRVFDFKLNTQCSAGNGYFLQGMAEQFGIAIEEYADHAFRARKAPAFNYGCAVFMEQDKVNFQQLGWSKEEIMAGLALVLPLNIWNYVVQETNLARLGRRIVLQGGTQRNLAAVKAQVDYIRSKAPGAEVFVHKYADIGGAIGAALEIKKRGNDAPSTFSGLDHASSVAFETRNDRTTRCHFCGNQCPRTFIDIHVTADKTVRYISGYGCERGMDENAEEMRRRRERRRDVQQRYPNLVAMAAREVFADYEAEKPPASLERSSPASRENMVIGMPRLLNMYMYAPFFNAYFRALGVSRIVYSDETSARLWNEGNTFGAIDPCFPAKVAPAHIYNLLKKKEITHICFPRITHLESLVENTLGNNACVIQMGTPEVAEAVFTRNTDYFADADVEYWKPLVRMDRRLETIGEMHAYFADRLGITADENRWAVEQGFAAMGRYVSDLRSAGAEILNRLIDEDKMGILVIGHPYHHDRGLNHGILEEFQQRGFPVLCTEALPQDDAFLGPLFMDDSREQEAHAARDIKDVWQRNFNRNTNIKIWAAKVAARHPNLAVLDFSSFKCGHDAPTYSYIDGILDASETPHFLFHDIDQNKPRATINIRIQTIEYFLRLEEQRLRSRARELAV